MSRLVVRSVTLSGLAGVLLAAYPVSRLPAQDTAAVKASHDSVQVRFVDTDLRAVIQALGRHLSKPVIIGPIPATRVSIETPGPVSSGTLKGLLAQLVQSQGLQFTEDSITYRVDQPPPAPAAPPATVGLGMGNTGEPMQLFVIHLKHARAADVAATVNQLFGGSGRFSGGGGLNTNTLSDELHRNGVP
ncbi:MAG TPA: hypothetical protein VNX15_07555, partial [Gemmatimonadales bacterium]|nr:hypothetical protein [Gemmatimonadales bacterium]